MSFEEWSVYTIFLFPFLAETRTIGVPEDLESEIKGMLSTSKLLLKHTRHWLSHRSRKESTGVTAAAAMSNDYRSIIEGLQVNFVICR